MKEELSSLDLHYLLNELKVLEGSKIDSIYQPEKKELLLQLYKSGQGKVLLRITPSLLYISSYKKPNPENPYNFCMSLRKHLKSARIQEIVQLDSERIVKVVFSTKEKEFNLIIELFSKGNVLLCDQDLKIISLQEFQRWKDRTLKPGQFYSYPKKEFNFLSPDLKVLKSIFKDSKKSLVKTLAIDLGLGGVYANEVCILSEIDKDEKEINVKKAEKIFKIIKSIIAKKAEPNIIYKKGEIFCFEPFSLEYFKDYEKKPLKEINSLLDDVFTEKILETEKEEVLSKHEKQIKKAEEIINIQTDQLKNLKINSKEYKEKAEKIYENYALIGNLILDINKIVKKFSAKEIKEKLKGHKLIKEINFKDKSILIEL